MATPNRILKNRNAGNTTVPGSMPQNARLNMSQAPAGTNPAKQRNDNSDINAIFSGMQQTRGMVKRGLSGAILNPDGTDPGNSFARFKQQNPQLGGDPGVGGQADPNSDINAIFRGMQQMRGGIRRGLSGAILNPDGTDPGNSFDQFMARNPHLQRGAASQQAANDAIAQQRFARLYPKNAASLAASRGGLPPSISPPGGATAGAVEPARSAQGAPGGESAPVKFSPSEIAWAKQQKANRKANTVTAQLPNLESSGMRDMGTPETQRNNQRLLDMALKDPAAQGDSPRAAAYRDMLKQSYLGGGEAGKTQAMKAFYNQFPSIETQGARREAANARLALNLANQAYGFMNDPTIQKAQASQDELFDQMFGQEGLTGIVNAAVGAEPAMSDWERQNPELAAALAKRDAGEANMSKLLNMSAALLRGVPAETVMMPPATQQEIEKMLQENTAKFGPPTIRQPQPQPSSSQKILNFLQSMREGRPGMTL